MSHAHRKRIREQLGARSLGFRFYGSRKMVQTIKNHLNGGIRWERKKEARRQWKKRQVELVNQAVRIMQNQKEKSGILYYRGIPITTTTWTLE